jgi:hypothetical protein
VSWKQLLADKDAQPHTTSKGEMDGMRALIARDLSDASVAGLSADRRYATAYNAALQAANMAIACAGYRITAKIGHHKVSIEAARLALGASADDLLDFFDTCRRKRNRRRSCMTVGRRLGWLSKAKVKHHFFKLEWVFAIRFSTSSANSRAFRTNSFAPVSVATFACA